MPKKKRPTLRQQRRKTAEFRKVADETLSHVRLTSFESVKLRRVRYKDNPHDFIDIRIFQRGYDDDEREIHYPTRKGLHIKEELFLKLMKGY